MTEVIPMSLPALTNEAGLSQYLTTIQKFPMLTEEEELDLAKSWIHDNDLTAAHKLVTSHLRLVAKVAFKFKGYGLPLLDLISEGNIGLMKAVKKFDPEKGYRLATYAIWWIKASIQEYVIKSFGLLKIGTSAMQKKMFFNLKKAKNNILSQGVDSQDLSDYNAQIAQELGVKKSYVEALDAILTNPVKSLDSSASEENYTPMESIKEPSANQEEQMIDQETRTRRQGLLKQHMNLLNEREQEILKARRIQTKPSTLDQLASIYNISRERVRQIEEAAFKKLQKSIMCAEQHS